MNARPNINIDQASEMWGKNASISDIAVHFGVSRGTVSGMMGRFRDLFPKKTGGKMDCRSPGYVKGQTRGRRKRGEAELMNASIREARDSGSAYDAERLPHAKTLIDLGAKECHWPLRRKRGTGLLRSEATDGDQKGNPTYCRCHYLRRLPLRAASDLEGV